jgi:cadmium resistance protein CadD (predicted permease)
MGGITSTLGAAAGVFAGTNIDDMIVLTMLFLSARASGQPRVWQVWAGQYAGIATLVAVSVIAALGLRIVPDDWVGLLGLIPFTLGVRGLIKAMRARQAGHVAGPAVATGLVSVMGVTIANGADNISVYTPVFRTIGPSGTVVTIVVFAAGVSLWCLTGSWLGSHKKVVEFTERYGHWIVPAVFTIIGVVIVIESGVSGRVI